MLRPACTRGGGASTISVPYRLKGGNRGLGHGGTGEASMNTQLREHVESLHAELGATRAVDREARQALAALLGDIQRLLDKPQWDDPPDEKVTERLEALAVGFEAEHPALGTAIRQVIDALGKAGF